MPTTQNKTSGQHTVHGFLRVALDLSRPARRRLRCLADVPLGLLHLPPVVNPAFVLL